MFVYNTALSMCTVLCIISPELIYPVTESVYSSIKSYPCSPLPSPWLLLFLLCMSFFFFFNSTYVKDYTLFVFFRLAYFTYHSALQVHQFSSVQFSRLVMSDSLRPHESQHARPPCPTLSQMAGFPYFIQLNNILLCLCAPLS